MSSLSQPSLSPSSLSVLRRLRLLIVVLSACVFLVLASIVLPTAVAQEVECEEVTYNERIIIKCTTVQPGESGSGGTEPTPTPTSTVEPDDGGDEGPADTSAADGNAEDDVAGQDPPDAADSPEEANSTTPGEEIDREDRGTRSNVDAPNADGSNADADEDGPNTSAQGDDSSTSGAGNESIVEPDDGQQGNESESLANDGSENTTENDPSNLPIVVGVVGLFGVGAAFFVAEARNRRPAEDLS